MPAALHSTILMIVHIIIGFAAQPSIRNDLTTYQF